MRMKYMITECDNSGCDLGVILCSCAANDKGEPDLKDDSCAGSGIKPCPKCKQRGGGLIAKKIPGGWWERLIMIHEPINDLRFRTKRQAEKYIEDNYDIV